MTETDRMIYHMRFEERKPRSTCAEELKATLSEYAKLEDGFLRKLRCPRIAMALAYGLNKSATLQELTCVKDRYNNAMAEFADTAAYIERIKSESNKIEAINREVNALTPTQVEMGVQMGLCSVISKLRERAGVSKADDAEIEVLNLSHRSYNGLRQAKVRTIGDLKRQNVAALSHIRNLGKKSVAEILTALKNYDETELPIDSWQQLKRHTSWL